MPCPPPGDLLNPGIKPRSPALQADSLLSKPSGNPGIKPGSPALQEDSLAAELPRKLHAAVISSLFFLMSRRLSASIYITSIHIFTHVVFVVRNDISVSSQILGIFISSHFSFYHTLRASQPMFLYMSLSQFISPLSLKICLLLPMLKSHCSPFCNPNRNVFIQFEG